MWIFTYIWAWLPWKRVIMCIQHSIGPSTVPYAKQVQNKWFIKSWRGFKSAHYRLPPPPGADLLREFLVMLEFGYVWEILLMQCTWTPSKSNFEGDQRRFVMVEEMKSFEFHLAVPEIQVTHRVRIALESSSPTHPSTSQWILVSGWIQNSYSPKPVNYHVPISFCACSNFFFSIMISHCWKLLPVA